MRRIIISILIAISIVSCEKNSGPVFIDPGESLISGSGLFILNEGNFMAGNGSLSFFSYDSSRVINHLFSKINKYPLGDIPHSMKIAGNNAFIVVNNSNKIEVVKAINLESVTTITGLKSPRYLEILSNNTGYVTSLWSDSVTIIDLNSLAISGYINLRRSSESIAVVDVYAYIAHWYGGNEIMVVDTRNNSVVDSIPVGAEPESMVVDKNNTLWVLCNGGWERNYHAELIGINTRTNEIVKRFVFPDINDSPTSLQANKGRDTLYYLEKGVRRIRIDDAGLPASPFISENGHTFYKMAVFPETGDIFVSDPVDYQQKGFVIRYSRDGALVAAMEAGIIPGGMCNRIMLPHWTE